MNGIFFILLLCSIVTLLFSNPSMVMTAMLSGGEKALNLTLTMVSLYAVWLGLLQIASQCNLTEKLAKLLKKPIRLLFGRVSEKAEEYIAMNLSANLLGMGGVATPMGVNAISELDKDENLFAEGMLFVLASTSIQLLPTSVIALRESAGSLSSTDIIAPSLLATTISTVLGITLFFMFGRRKKL